MLAGNRIDAKKVKGSNHATCQFAITSFRLRKTVKGRERETEREREREREKECVCDGGGERAIKRENELMV